jgi:hypothetical protein
MPGEASDSVIAPRSSSLATLESSAHTESMKFSIRGRQLSNTAWTFSSAATRVLASAVMASTRSHSEDSISVTRDDTWCSRSARKLDTASPSPARSDARSVAWLATDASRTR